MQTTITYPFTAIVGQQDMKLALILNIINPALGGVLIKGEKGTAKSTAVRALAGLLPALEVARGCRYRCDPLGETNLCPDCYGRISAREARESSYARMRVVELPVSATDDRVVGTLDIEHALKTGEKRFEPGILADANRNLLYVDEINLLDDHVVDVLLDAAAMGVNTVEREGVSYSHPARFVLVGTMNPEEGDLRPQLVDRFGLSVTVTGEHELNERVEVIKRRLSFEQDPAQFAKLYEEQQRQLADNIVRARAALPAIRLDDELLLLTAQLAIELSVDGHRADLTVIKTALALAAFNGRPAVTAEDIKQAVRLALPHRMRRRPFEEGVLDWDKIEAVFARRQA